MKQLIRFLLFTLLIGSAALCSTQRSNPLVEDATILSYTLDPQQQDLNFYWRNNEGENYKNFKNLQTALAKENQELLFAMNGGMYLKDGSPQGLFIENGKIQKGLDTSAAGYGNFYLQPNGVFYLTETKEAFITTTQDFKLSPQIQYATQSGPMLLIDGAIHPKFTEGSKNVHIRNGVGVLPDGRLLFAMSKKKINFFDFASFFKKNDCQNALYLDGFVSRTYLPAKNWEQLDGNFGVIIGEVRTKQ